MKRILLLALLTLSACAHGTALQRAQQSHDVLALAQDAEAQLCWNVPNVAAAIAANVTPSHCTAPGAPVIGLTDARHQAFNAEMKTALELHRAATVVAASGGTADVTAFKASLAKLIALIHQLVPGGTVLATLQAYLEKAGAL